MRELRDFATYISFGNIHFMEKFVSNSPKLVTGFLRHLVFDFVGYPFLGKLLENVTIIVDFGKVVIEIEILK